DGGGALHADGGEQRAQLPYCARLPAPPAADGAASSARARRPQGAGRAQGGLMHAMLTAVTAAALLAGGLLALAATAHRSSYARVPKAGEARAPKRIIIGTGLSKSNPLIDTPPFAAKVAQRIAGQIHSLGFASEVHVRTFGNFDASSNTFAYDTVISTHA